jgi:hypothetical protein
MSCHEPMRTMRVMICKKKFNGWDERVRGDDDAEDNEDGRNEEGKKTREKRKYEKKQM